MAKTPKTEIAGIGDNSRDPAPAIIDRLKVEYPAVIDLVQTFQIEMDKLPAEITTKAENDQAADLITRIRERVKGVEAQRESEKDPYLKSERAVDGFFVPARTGLEKFMADINRRSTLYLRKVADEERRVREERAAEAARLAAAKRAEEAAATAREQAAKRSDTRERFAAAADNAARDAAQLEEYAGHAARAVDVKPAELARQRSAIGTVSTLKTVWTHEVEDYALIPLEELRPYIKTEAIEQAIKAYVKIHQGKKPLAGVRIFQDSTAAHR